MSLSASQSPYEVELMAEQLRHLADREALVDRQVDLVNSTWAKRFGARNEVRGDASYWVLPDGRFPQEGSIRMFLRKLPLDRLIEAIDLTAGKFRRPYPSACSYFYGVCWCMVRELEAR